jgi:hypothetical protein
MRNVLILVAGLTALGFAACEQPDESMGDMSREEMDAMMAEPDTRDRMMEMMMEDRAMRRMMMERMMEDSAAHREMTEMMRGMPSMEGMEGKTGMEGMPRDTAR